MVGFFERLQIVLEITPILSEIDLWATKERTKERPLVMDTFGSVYESKSIQNWLIVARLCSTFVGFSKRLHFVPQNSREYHKSEAIKETFDHASTVS